MSLRRGEFLLNGLSSIDTYGARIQERFDLPFPKRRFTTAVAMGQDGQTIYDEEAYDDVKITLNIVVNPLKGKDMSYMRNLLLTAFTGNGGSYIPFIPWFDDTKIYMLHLDGDAAVVNKYFFENRFIVPIPVTIKPWKALLGSTDMTIVSGPTGSKLDNQSMYSSQPIFTATTGSSTNNHEIIVNGVPFKINNVPNKVITIDCERYFTGVVSAGGVVTDNLNKYVTTREYPILKPGINTIRFNGFTSLKMNPRLRVLV